MSDVEVEDLRALVLSDRRTRRGPFSEGLRQKLMVFIQRERAQGKTVEHVSRTLGISSKTVHIWLKPSAKKTPRLRRVDVVGEAKSGKVEMLGPCGTRVEGLSLAQVAELWRKLS